MALAKQMSRNIFEVFVSIYDKKHKPVRVEILKELTGTEILNYLRFSKKMDIPEDYLILVSTNSQSYHLVEPTHTLARYIETKSAELLIFPPKIHTSVHCADNRVNVRFFSSKSLISDVITSLCNDVFRLSDDSAFALFPINDFFSDPFRLTMSLAECHQKMDDVWFFRRFWTRPMEKDVEESDLHFSYSQAELIMFREDFPSENYNIPLLAALSLTVKFDGDGKKAYSFIKKANKKDFPKYLAPCVINNKKYFEASLKILNEKGTMPIVDAKRLFIETMLAFPFFGTPLFPVQTFENKKQPENITLTTADDHIILLKKDSFIEIRRIKLSRVRKFKQTGINEVTFYIYDAQDQAEGKHQLQELVFRTTSPLTVVDYFLGLLHFIKRQRVNERLSKFGPGSRDTHERRNTIRTKNSLSGLLSSDLLLGNATPDSEIAFSGVRNVQLPKVEEPAAQPVVSIQVETVMLPRERGEIVVNDANYVGRYKVEYYDGYSIQIIHDSCKIVKKAISGDIYPALSEAEALLSVYEPSTPFLKSSLKNLLHESGSSSGDIANVVSRSLSYLIDNRLTFLDTLYGMLLLKNIIIRFIFSQIQNLNMVETAKEISNTFGNITSILLSQKQNLTLPLAYVTLEALSRNNEEECKYLLSICDIGVHLLFYAVICVIKSYIATGFGTDKFVPIIDSLPILAVFDPFIGNNIAENLKNWTNTISTSEHSMRQVLSLPRKSKMEFQSIIEVVNDFCYLLDFLRSPISLYLQSITPRLSTAHHYPETIYDASMQFQIARESANFLWNTNHGDLATVTSSNAQTFYNLYLASLSDSSLQLQVQEAHKHLVSIIQENSAIINNNCDLSSYIDPNDAINSVILSLTNPNENENATITLLFLDAASEIQRKTMLANAYEQLDSYLRDVNAVDTNQLGQNFTVFSFAALSLMKDNPEIHRLKLKLAEVGASLNTLFSPQTTLETKRAEGLKLRNQFRPIMSLATGQISSVDMVLDPKAENRTSYDLVFNIPQPNILEKLEGLRQLAEDMKLICKYKKSDTENAEQKG